MSACLPTDEQQAIADGVAAFLSTHFPVERLRASHTSDREQWQALAALGAFGMSLPAAEGGLGLSWVDEVHVCREAGRFLVSPALIGSILAVRVASRVGLSALCSEVLTGVRRAGIGMRLPAPGLIPSLAGTRVIDTDGDLFLRVEPQRVQLVECDVDALRKLACIDESVALYDAQLTVSAFASVEGDEFALAAHLLSAAMLCGLLEQTRDMAADYARARVQFGRPIGAFQAIKHRCADIALGAELCWSQTLRAADALATGAVDAQFHVWSAKLLAGEEALKATRFNIQAHGAMGFTEEVDAHRLLKRTHVLHQLFADPRSVRAALVDLELEF